RRRGGRAAAAAGGDGDVGAAAALVALGRQDLVVRGAEVQAEALPRVEDVGDRDGAAGALGLTDRPVLVERGSALDRGFVGPGRLVQVVGAAVAVDGAELGGARTGVVVAVVVDDVVLDQWVRGPSVERQVAVAVAVPGAGVGHGVARAGVPAGAGDDVLRRGVPGEAVVAARAQRHGGAAGLLPE